MNRNCRRKTERVYVKVNSDFDATGYMQPRQITWGDGRTYPIEQVRDYGIFASTIGAVLGYVCCIFVGAAQTDILQMVEVPVAAILEAAAVSVAACLAATAIPLRAISRMNIVDSIETGE